MCSVTPLVSYVLKTSRACYGLDSFSFCFVLFVCLFVFLVFFPSFPNNVNDEIGSEIEWKSPNKKLYKYEAKVTNDRAMVSLLLYKYRTI